MTTHEIELLKSGKHLRVRTSTGREIVIGIVTASLGVKFVAVFKHGQRVKSSRKAQTSIMCNTWTCNDWLDHLEFVELSHVGRIGGKL